MIYLYYIYFENCLSEIEYTDLVKILSTSEKDENSTLLRWQERQSNLFSKLLIKFGVKEILGESINQQLKYTKNNKPFFDKGPFFNISHSGNYVICGISETDELGVDIEKKMPIDINNLQFIFTESEWILLNESNNPKKDYFYDLWTIKEAVIKADGIGLTFPLACINTLQNPISLNDRSWYVHKIEIDNLYSCHVASNNNTPVFVKKILLTDLMN